MHRVTLPAIGTATAWRDAARGLLAAGVPPEAVLWAEEGAGQSDLFAADAPPPPAGAITVPKSFVPLAQSVCWHAEPERFARLYAFLWRLQGSPRLMADRGDESLAQLRQMEKQVRRCAHKMTAFVRFREIEGGGPRRRFAAWFEPTHHTLEPTAPHFAKRFADMDWAIFTPALSAHFEGGELRFAEGAPRPDLPEDAADALWGTYFRNIFNPARLKVKAMTSEMPKKYWKNLPEARHIPELIATAEARAAEMAAKAPTLPPARAARILQRLHTEEKVSWEELAAKAEEENRHGREGYGRFVMGEGPHDARLIIVGEQPGDMEDEAGRPFVGPSGQLLDKAAEAAGLNRREAYVTNAVKRFKFERRGKRRIHQSPDRSDIEHARWWLSREIELIRPRLILALGGTAAETLTGQRAGILKRRGHVEETEYGPVLLSLHPSYILRQPDAGAQAEARADLEADLAEAARRIAA
ncbi:UdgX family uracil-DNA binding protein [Pseudoroseicyclus tamaricis]|uniref:Type-4 uracil-DNA glycosylase n=1 Tax=Pseudoroseicyclus tamaricis TaxID=2705421 RepID=A0A6B2K5I6_9RHOB|nr:UdgX family uracil-DNA binding protein [Pseudoroseicyclus tamaricis]NDV02036.1 UdgX family uracil-DNA binding protein [Pseudoroseicyclus tamaricis]